MMSQKGLLKALNVNGLSKTVGQMCLWFGFVHLSIGLVSIFAPHLYEQGAYEWVTNIMPIRAWGFFMVLNGILLAWSGWFRKTEAARIGLVIYTGIQWVFAASIWVLTLDGQWGAFAGTLQWMTGPAIGFILLIRPLKERSANETVDLDFDFNVHIDREKMDVTVDGVHRHVDFHEDSDGS